MFVYGGSRFGAQQSGRILLVGPNMFSTDAEKKVLITGISGFAGQYMAQNMYRNGYSVHGTVNGIPDRHSSDKYHLHRADLRSLEDISRVVNEVKPSYVIHLAAISFVAHEDVNEIYQVNVVGTRNLLSALAKLDRAPQAVLLTSSANVYGNARKEILTEDDDINPANDYAVSKIAMEYMSRQFFNRLNIIVARPFNYTGRGQAENFLIPKIVNHFRRKTDTIELGNLDISRDFSDVRSVVDYFRRLIESKITENEIYNICSGKAHSLNRVIQICQILTSHSMEINVNPKFIRANEVKSLVGSAKKLKAAVGETQEFSLEDTLEWMLSEPL
jgi:nucleoside-diphosphate-sugar epimerase